MHPSIIRNTGGFAPAVRMPAQLWLVRKRNLMLKPTPNHVNRIRAPRHPMTGPTLMQALTQSLRCTALRIWPIVLAGPCLNGELHLGILGILLLPRNLVLRRSALRAPPDDLAHSPYCAALKRRRATKYHGMSNMLAPGGGFRDLKPHCLGI